MVAEYLEKSGLQKDLDKLGFNLVGFGCTTCIGNSGPLPAPISKTINDKGLIAAAVLSGNRNFEGRVSPDVQANYLASPPLVVAYALAGTVHEGPAPPSRIGEDQDGKPVYLEDIWPTSQEIQEFIAEVRHARAVRHANMPTSSRATTTGRRCRRRQARPIPGTTTRPMCRTRPISSAWARPAPASADIKGARVLGLFGDKITTDHISPAGSIKAASPAGTYLTEHGVGVADFNQYGTRRGNHEVMMRGTFANIRIRNHMLGPNGKEGGYTIHYPSKEEMSIYDAAMLYKAEGRSARHLRRCRIRQRLVARLGCQGHQPARRARRRRRSPSSASTARTWSAWASSPSSSRRAPPGPALGLKGDETVTIDGLEYIKPRERKMRQGHLWRRHGEGHSDPLPHRYAG